MPRLWPFWVAYLGLYGRIGFIFPFLFLFWKESGCSIAQISRISLVNCIASIAMQQVWGYVADVVLTRRQVALLLIAFSGAVISAFYAFPSGLGGLGTYHTFLVFGVLVGALTAPIHQLMNGLTFADAEAARHFPVLRAAGSVAFIVTNLGFGYAIDRFGLNLSAAWPLYLASTLLTLAGVATIPCSQRATRRPDARLSFAKAQTLLMRNPRIAGALGLVLIYQTSFSMGYNVLQPFYIDDTLHLGKTVLAGCYALAAVAEVPFFLAGDLIIRRVGAMRCLFLACAFNVVRWLGMYLTTSPAGLLGLSLLHSFTFGLFYFSLVRYIDLHADLRLKASAQTLLGIAYSGFGDLLANAIVHSLLDRFGLSVRESYLVVSVIAGGALLYMSAFWLAERRMEPVPALG